MQDVGLSADQITRELKRKGNKVILIGAERRGLVAAAAAFLVKEGLSVTVYEKRQTIEGGSNEKNSRVSIQL
jgi:ribulose 1,5-bisphosphate synthetase/thiazole synthase